MPKDYAVIYDHDGTLILNREKYRKTSKGCARLVKRLLNLDADPGTISLVASGIDKAEFLSRPPETKLKRDRFPTSWAKTVRLFAGRELPEMERVVYLEAEKAFFPPWKERPGAFGALEKLREDGRFDLYLLTAGDPLVKKRKYEAIPQLKKHFDWRTSIFIVPFEKAETLREIIRRGGYRPENVVVVGDSTVEIMAGLEMGARAIFTPLDEGSWTDQTGGFGKAGVVKTRRMAEVPGIILRLLSRKGRGR
jgi:FMN phosphatase YigB (HAD superfamily)